MFAFVRHSVNKCVSEKLLTESKDISMSAPQHPISVSAASALFCQLCLHLRNSVQKWQTEKEQRRRLSITRSREGGRALERGLNWERWPWAALESRVAVSVHSKLHLTIWTPRQWRRRCSMGPSTGCSRTECSIWVQPTAHRWLYMEVSIDVLDKLSLSDDWKILTKGKWRSYT